ncbi:oligoribonuclease [Wohlfahrtiimonas chitiniclastica]|uniref:oligoribonuclease n=1 Tax=Wohlfahrtiimonas chitiniclastica TaxID=400946 RepID=UPI000B995D33|nr:oligoribonuclease [Wohlfahrtiimonas chitiniclastica]OYQ88775.1 oligoribonuclease [Wohlfahrtiimonas chitiniclastica]
MQSDRYLFWVDLEMTGLEENLDHIIEIASIVTDSDLNVVAEGPVIAIHQSDDVLDLMDDWNQKTHGESGLIERVRESNISLAEAEEMTYEFLRLWIAKGSSPLCGNSIGTDRRFLKRYMPHIDQYLHYRNVDVSSFKEMIKRWYPDGAMYEKQNTHKALDDIRESIGELKFYRTHYLQQH